MAKIIQFQKVEQPVSNGYHNLSGLIAIADSASAVNFFLESAELLESQGNLLDGEAEKLEEQGRAKRLEITKPEQKEPEAVEGPGVYTFTPEMGQAKPNCQMEAHRAYYGKHWFIDAPMELQGRGITFIKKYYEKDFCNPEDHRVGWNEYRVTDNAFKKLKKQYSISMECLLD
ncbi:MAG: hypothetical protein Q4B26_11960 [Eubacteriales bacterium]|nr:hypothetical protein [Eubacteriales bacterium]